jgi:hypothetical protein
MADPTITTQTKSYFENWNRPLKIGLFIAFAVNFFLILFINSSFLDLKFLVPSVIAITIIVALIFKLFGNKPSVPENVRPNSGAINTNLKPNYYGVGIKIGLILTLVFFAYLIKMAYALGDASFNLLVIFLAGWPFVLGGTLLIFVCSILGTKVYCNFKNK